MIKLLFYAFTTIREGRDRVNSILTNKNDVKKPNKVPEIKKFKYYNGYYSSVTALFVDIKNSTKLFEEHKYTSTSKIIRAFTSEIIEILNCNKNLREIGIRGDCVYGIYTCESKDENYEIAQKAFYINTYLKMLNKLLSNMKMKNIVAGIGVANGKVLVIKAGREGSGVDNLAWIGEAVTHVSKFSGIAKRNVNKVIIFSCSFYNLIKSRLQRDGKLYSNLESIDFLNTKKLNDCYSCDIKVKKFNEWIDGGMK